MIVGIETSIVLFFALLAAMEFGRWLRRRHMSEDSVGQDSAAAEGVVFTVLGLLIAFTFTSAASRFDERRKLIVEQANAIGTAWLRVDLLPESDREPIRKPLRQWVKLFLDVMPQSGDADSAELNAAYNKGQDLQNQAWAAAIDAAQRNPRPQYASLILSPLNDWIDLSTTRVEMSRRGPPPLVMPTLLALAITAGLLAGYGMGKKRERSLLHILAFAGAISFSIYVIIDLNHPRSGLIRIDAADHAMEQLYESMTSNLNVTTTQPQHP